MDDRVGSGGFGYRRGGSGCYAGTEKVEREEEGRDLCGRGQGQFKEMAGTAGVSMAVLWGDPDKGAHGAFTKFVPGYDAGMHTHTNDVWIVGVKGAYLYKDDAGEKRVGPGDFLRVPGGHKHWSGGDKTEGAVFYEEGSAKFDIIPAQ